MQGGKPLWASQQRIRDLYSVPEHRLMALVRAGVVRSCKFARSRQAARLFHVGDVERVLHAIRGGSRAPTPHTASLQANPPNGQEGGAPVRGRAATPMALAVAECANHRQTGCLGADLLGRFTLPLPRCLLRLKLPCT